ncbi:hypothetical protein AVEN_173236-1 [Araneus ventricosus]|uniref:Uncharacterized protein n=1 Tax=Araneus ventricosus TaxID=182803 RepID=A0A4Y2GZK4_ARAVE|nr:hypothetical protein AVEN_173236-1 [Araneus ventricosus]
MARQSVEHEAERAGEAGFVFDECHSLPTTGDGDEARTTHHHKFDFCLPSPLSFFAQIHTHTNTHFDFVSIPTWAAMRKTCFAECDFVLCAQWSRELSWQKEAMYVKRQQNVKREDTREWEGKKWIPEKSSWLTVWYPSS